MYNLEETYYFKFLIIIPIILIIYLLLNNWKSRAKKKFSDSYLLSNLLIYNYKNTPLLKIILICLFFSFMTIALVNPQKGGKVKMVESKASDVLFIIDVSKSMLCEDISPNRLEKAKQIVSKAIDQIGSIDRIGIIVYAGNAYPLLPITSDYEIAKMYLRQIDTDMISSMGTSIGDALGIADNYFDIKDAAGKMIFIFSDGEDHDPIAFQYNIQKKSNQGVNIFTFGIGTPKGGPIPIKINNKISDYKKDRKGNIVVTKLNRETLKQIAKIGNGKYIETSETIKAVNFITETVKSAKKREGKSHKLIEYEQEFQWFIGIAIILLIIESLLFEGKIIRK